MNKNELLNMNEVQEEDQDGMKEKMHPDMIGHTLSVSDGDPVRVYIEDEEITIPINPVKERRGSKTESVQCTYFDAIVDFVDVADGGETVWARFHLPKTEWRRLRLHEHWEKENAEEYPAVAMNVERFPVVGFIPRLKPMGFRLAPL